MAACFEESQKIDPTDAIAWRHPGIAGGGTASARTTQAACFDDSLKLDPNDAIAGRHLGIAEDGKVSARTTARPLARRVTEVESH